MSETDSSLQAEIVVQGPFVQLEGPVLILDGLNVAVQLGQDRGSPIVGVAQRQACARQSSIIGQDGLQTGDGFDKPGQSGLGLTLVKH
jgi:hypothetical protein